MEGRAQRGGVVGGQQIPIQPSGIAGQDELDLAQPAAASRLRRRRRAMAATRVPTPFRGSRLPTQRTYGRPARPQRRQDGVAGPPESTVDLGHAVGHHPDPVGRDRRVLGDLGGGGLADGEHQVGPAAGGRQTPGGGSGGLGPGRTRETAPARRRERSRPAGHPDGVGPRPTGRGPDRLRAGPAAGASPGPASPRRGPGGATPARPCGPR